MDIPLPEKRPILGRRSEHRRRRFPSETVMSQHIPLTSPSRSYRRGYSDRVSWRTAPQATSGRIPLPKAKVNRRHKGRARSFGARGRRDKHGRKSRNFASTIRKAAVRTKSAREWGQHSSRNQNDSGSGEEMEEGSLGCSDGPIVGADRIHRETDGDPAERAKMIFAPRRRNHLAQGMMGFGIGAIPRTTTSIDLQSRG